MRLISCLNIVLLLTLIASCKDDGLQSKENQHDAIRVKSMISVDDGLGGTWKVRNLSVYGGAWPEFGGSAIFEDIASRNWNWNFDGTGPIADYDNTLIFVEAGTDTSGNPYGTLSHEAGFDQMYADFIFIDDPDGTRTPIDVNYHYRKIPTRESTWKFYKSERKIVFTDSEGNNTTGYLTYPGSMQLDQNVNFELKNYAIEFELEPNYKWIDIYKDREKFVENPKKFWVQLEKISNSVIDANRELIITTQTTKATPFVGIGPQWGGYDNIEKWTGSATLSNADWEKLFQRVDFMRPGLVRLMGSPGWNYMIDGQYDVQKSAGILFKILDYCQAKNINVMWGEWGQRPVNGNQADVQWLEHSTDFLNYLINIKGYTCIKYYNMCNEPAGSWSSIAGDYDLWQRTYEHIFAKMEAKGLSSKVKVIAPDIAIWNDMSLGHWITNARNYFGEKINAYDIHTYPSDEQVKGGSYKRAIQGHRDLVPDHLEMIMGELGYKYDENSSLGQYNKQRIASDEHSSDDSNMMVYDAFYGVDVADATIQNLNTGYNGVILWDMDDAMYDDGNNKLKRWGFWNILGQERFGGVWDEEIRPWFYPMSLMCRYFPQGSTIYRTITPEKRGLSSTCAMKGNRYTIAIANSNTEEHTIRLKMDFDIVLENTKHYKYIAGDGSYFEGVKDENGFPIPHKLQDMDFNNGVYHEFVVPARSLILITNMD